jgi:hypothetical protein
MSGLRKEDPVYYKVAVNKLIKQAKDNGLNIGFITSGNGSNHIRKIEISFENDIGEKACATAYEEMEE